MADKLRKKTKTNCVYLNTKTKKYDVKYNFKVYNPETNKNDYKAEWITGLETIEEAKKALAARRTEARKKEDTDITLEGAYKLWEIEAKAIPYSPVTIDNTKQHCKMIYQQQFDAFVDIAFNGGGQMELAMNDIFVNKMDPREAFTYGESYYGLFCRRNDEANIFLEGRYERTYPEWNY